MSDTEVGTPLDPGRARPWEWRQIRSWHEQPELIAWWEQRVRRLFEWLPPARMRAALSAAAVAACIARAWTDHAELGVSLAWRVSVILPVAIGLPWLVYRAALRMDRWPRFLRRRPQWALHAVLWSVFAAAWLLPVRGAVNGALALLTLAFFTHMIWRLGYLLKSAQHGKLAGTRFADHIFYVWPVWSGGHTPFGKGFEYLVRHQARDSTEFARSQLAGLKLILLSIALQGVKYLWAGAVFGDTHNRVAELLRGHDLGIPRLQQLIAHREEYSLASAWIGIYCQLVWVTLLVAAKGHLWIGWLRLLGFNVFRNTYKPLLAESVVDFWNRYYFYFKELLVEFFFYPTFARLRVRPWLRTLGAVFAAAFAGNLYYHMINDIDRLSTGNVASIGSAFASRTLYSFLLAVGIFVSMMREQRRRGRQGEQRPGLGRRVLRIAGVWTFFSLILVWDRIDDHPGFDACTRFFLSLFGL